MSMLVVCIHIMVCLVLIIVILLQAGRGQGLTGANFGGNVQSLFGTKANSFLTKATSVSAILFLFTCIGLNVIDIQKSRSLFHAKNAQVPLDVEQIKKALEKIKKTDKSGKLIPSKLVAASKSVKTAPDAALASAKTAQTKVVVSDKAGSTKK